MSLAFRTAYLGLGTNCSDRMENLRAAVAWLHAASPGLRVQAISPLYESDAMLLPDSPPEWNLPFLNLVVSVQTDLDPLALLRLVKEGERLLGRQARGRWAPREIDIDVLAMEGESFESEALTLPHSGLLGRPFALLPLADLAPGWIHPSGRATASERVRRWKKDCEGVIPFGTRRSPRFLPELMGVLNLTPDSFSDGGVLDSVEEILERATHLAVQGATVLDFGAESTRPGATPLTAEEEWARLAPGMERLAEIRGQLGSRVRISLDTRHPKTAARALKLGVDWINDVSGGESAAMREVVASSDCDYVFMHSLTVPADRGRLLPHGEDPVSEILQWAQERIALLERDGIKRSRLIFDPGLGFGKDAEQSLEIVRRIREFRSLGVRILVGHSRKSLFSRWTQRPAAERDLETSVISTLLASAGVEYLRVHDVGSNRRALETWAMAGDGARLV